MLLGLLLCACSGTSKGPLSSGAASDAGSQSFPTASGPDAVTIPGPLREPGIEAWTKQIPPLPRDAGPGRRAAGFDSLALSGTQAIEAAPTALRDEEAGVLRLASDAAVKEWASCWALYRFELGATPVAPVQFELQSSGALPRTYYIGISDYTLGAWRWSRVPVPSGLDRVYAWGSRCISPQRNIYLVVAVADGEALGVSQLRLLGDIELPPPADFRASQDWPLGIRLSWTDPAESWDPDGPGPQEFEYDVVVVESAQQTAGPWTIEGSVLKGGTEFRFDNITDAAAPAFEKRIYYRLRTLSAGIYGPAGNASLGVRRVPVATGLHATQGSLSDRIELSWQPSAEPGTFFAVYRRKVEDIGAQPILRGSTSDLSFVDSSESSASGPDSLVHYFYYLQALADGGESALSPPVEGWRSMPLVQNLQASQGTLRAAIDVSWDPLPGCSGYRVLYGPFESLGGEYYEHVDLGTQTSWTLELPESETAVRPYSFAIAGITQYNKFDLSYCEPVTGFQDYRLQIQLSADKLDGASPLAVRLSASGSGPPGAKLEECEWDFEGDGVIDFETHGVTEVTHVYLPGLYCPVVKATDSAGRYETSNSLNIVSGGWLHSWGSTDWDACLAVTGASDGSSYCLVRYGNDVVDRELALLRYSPAGALIWSRQLGRDAAYAKVHITAGDNASAYVILTDYEDTTAAQKVLKLAADGTVSWCKTLDFSGLGGQTKLIGSCASISGGLLLGGNDGSFDGRAALARLDGGGNLVWLKEVQGTVPGESFHIRGLKSSGTSELLLSGYDNNGVCVVVADESGALLWQKSCAPGLAIQDSCISAAGSVYLLLLDYVDPYSYYSLAALAPGGALDWAESFDLAGTEIDDFRSLACHGGGLTLIANYHSSLWHSARARLSLGGALLSAETFPGLDFEAIGLNGSAVLIGGTVGKDFGFAQPVDLAISSMILTPLDSSFSLVDIAGSVGDASITVSDVLGRADQAQADRDVFVYQQGP